MIIASAIKFIPHFSKYPVIIAGSAMQIASKKHIRWGMNGIKKI